MPQHCQLNRSSIPGAISPLSVLSPALIVTTPERYRTFTARAELHQLKSVLRKLSSAGTG